MFPSLLFSPIHPFPRLQRQGLTLEEEQAILQASASSSPSRHRYDPTQRRRTAAPSLGGSTSGATNMSRELPHLSSDTSADPRTAFLHSSPLHPAAAVAAAAAASSAVRAAVMSQAGSSSTAGSSSSTTPYPAHLVPRPMFQGLPLSSGASVAAQSPNNRNLIGDALALRGSLSFKGFTSPNATPAASNTSSPPISSKSPLVSSSSLPTTLSSSSSSSPSSSATPSSSSAGLAMALQSLPLSSPAVTGLSPQSLGPPTAPHPALLLPGRPYPQLPPLDEEQLRYLSLAQIQAANQAHLAGEVAKLKQQSSPFLTRNYLELAMLVCNTFRGKLFPCPHCRYVTDRRNNLKRHVATMHQACDKQLECCGVRFSTKASLREHITIFHHNGYSCPFCGRRFCRKALLKRHLSVHSGQKDYTCPSCDYATSHKSNLERHKRIHARLHLMGDGSGMGADIDEEEIRRMEEEEEEEDRRRRRQAASMMMMLDEDDDETQDGDDAEKNENYQHRYGGEGEFSRDKPSGLVKSPPQLWPIPDLMKANNLSCFSNNFMLSNARTPFSLNENGNDKRQLNFSTRPNIGDNFSAHGDASTMNKDDDDDTDIDINVDVTDNDVEVTSTESDRRKEVPDSDKKSDTNAVGESSNVNNNNINNNNVKDKTKSLYRPFLSTDPANHVIDNQPMNLILGDKHGYTAADITMATRLAHGFAAVPPFPPRF